MIQSSTILIFIEKLFYIKKAHLLITRIFALFIEHSQNLKLYFLKTLITRTLLRDFDDVIIKNVNYKQLIKKIQKNFSIESNVYKLNVMQLNSQFLTRVKNNHHFINYLIIIIFCRLQFVNMYFFLDTLCKFFLLHKILIVVVEIKYNKLLNKSTKEITLKRSNNEIINNDEFEFVIFFVSKQRKINLKNRKNHDKT